MKWFEEMKRVMFKFVFIFFSCIWFVYWFLDVFSVLCFLTVISVLSNQTGSSVRIHNASLYGDFWSMIEWAQLWICCGYMP